MEDVAVACAKCLAEPLRAALEAANQLRRNSVLGEGMTCDIGYQEKQRGRYFYALAQGRFQVAHDALWRAASDANLLEHWEESGEGFNDERVQQLVQQLGWA